MYDSEHLMDYLRDRLPSVLTAQLLRTDQAEHRLLEDYAAGSNIPAEDLFAYKVAKNDERETLKLMIPEAGSYASSIINDYKELRRGEAWNHTRLDNKFKAFFQQPSKALTEYEALKKDELTSLDSFLSGQDQKAPASNGVEQLIAAESDMKLERKVRNDDFERQSDGDVAAAEEAEDATSGIAVAKTAASDVDPSVTITTVNPSKTNDRDMFI